MVVKRIIKNINDTIYLFKPFWKNGKLYIIGQIFTAAILIPLNRILYITLQKYIIDSLIAGELFLQICFGILSFSLSMLLLDLFDFAFFNLYGLKKYILIRGTIDKENYQKANKTDYKYFDDPEFYDNYTYAINERSNKAEQARLLLIRLIATSAVVISLTTLIATSRWVIILITVVSFCVSTLINNKIIKINHEKYLEEIPLNRKSGYINNLFYNKEYAADLKVNKSSYFLMKHYDCVLDDKVKVYKKYQVKSVVMGALGIVIDNLSEILISIYLVYLIVQGNISIGDFASMLTATGMLKSNMGEFFDLITRSNDLSIYADKIKQFYDLPSTIESSTDGKQPNENAFSVEFNNVNFKYNNSEFELKNINIKINPGEKIAIVGENGVGKTTLTKLLLRLYDPDSGEIKIDNTKISDYDVNKLRNKIGIAFQKPLVYAIPLCENMQLYNETTPETLINLLDKLQMTSILEKNNATLSTELTKEFDKSGIILSVGEAQKLGLSRIMFGDYGLLILDEPSSALDPIAEYELTKMIFDQANKATTIIISHRLSTIRNADRIYLIDNGEILEQGNHDELMHLKGRYYTMFTRQAENYIK